VENKQGFENKSYERHASWYADLFPTEEDKLKRIAVWKQTDTVNAWLHQRSYNQIEMLCTPNTHWLTVGDGNGADAAYLIKKGCKAIASDISGELLPVAKAEGLITDFSIENAEKLSFADNQFDYVLCKESFHHFPRPWMAFYEMLRVARRGIVLIEPHDPIIKMPFLLLITNILDRISPTAVQKLWKNRYSFEEVGNFVYKISEREVEKAAMGIGLPSAAFKGFNDHYIKGIENEAAVESSTLFAKMKSKIARKNLLSSLHLMPAGVLVSVVFKQKPEAEIIENLKKQDFRYVEFPTNPYLNH